MIDLTQFSRTLAEDIVSPASIAVSAGLDDAELRGLLYDAEYAREKEVDLVASRIGIRLGPELYRLAEEITTWRNRACFARDAAKQAGLMLDPEPGKELTYRDVDIARELLDECVAQSVGWVAELRGH